MKWRVSVCVVLLVLLIWGSAKFTGQTRPQELVALLHEFMEAAGRSDRGVFDKFFADDVIYTRATGAVITKADIMASLGKTSGAQENTTYAADSVTVHEYGDMAVVAFRLEGRSSKSDGTVAITHYRNTGTFLRRDGRWQAVAWQATKIADDAKPQ